MRVHTQTKYISSDICICGIAHVNVTICCNLPFISFITLCGGFSKNAQNLCLNIVCEWHLKLENEFHKRSSKNEIKYLYKLQILKKYFKLSTMRTEFCMQKKVFCFHKFFVKF